MRPTISRPWSMVCMLDLTGKVAIVTGASRGIGRGDCGACWRRAARSSSPRRAATMPPPPSRHSAAGGRPRRWRSTSPTPRRSNAMVAGVLAAARAHRHPGEQRGHHARPVDAADEARRLGPGDRDQPDAPRSRCVQAVVKPMIKQRARPHHQHQLGGRADGQCRARRTTRRRKPGSSGSARRWRGSWRRATSRSTSSRQG